MVSHYVWLSQKTVGVGLEQNKTSALSLYEGLLNHQNLSRA